MVGAAVPVHQVHPPAPELLERLDLRRIDHVLHHAGNHAPRLTRSSAPTRVRIRWRTRTGAPWRDVPERHGPWERVHDLFRRRQRDGTRARIPTRLQAEADAKGLITWDVDVDSTVCRAMVTPPASDSGSHDSPEAPQGQSVTGAGYRCLPRAGAPRPARSAGRWTVPRPRGGG
ncbi:transposase [Streptomyces sp. enrichment culture]|uniref:transposase n=1 Tax=Streptomyces sp. enrichment culture TaxID=1795815 RepID=UPI003F57F536